MNSKPFATIHDDVYKRSRQSPPLGHPHYLHLSDLLLALIQVTNDVQGIWLDYGSGASPYQFLFGECEYHRADLAGTGLDYQITPGQPLDAPGDYFDGILSTQVLEHVEDATGYLEDCWDLLKPGGKLILSTHGTWKEHGTPDDYWRYTEWGLRSRLSAVGFDILRMARLTSGPRAKLCLLFVGPKFKSEFFGHGLLATSIDLCFRWILRHKKQVHQLSDLAHREYRVVWDRQEAFYLGLLVVAQKPI